MAELKKVNFQIHQSHLPLWERSDWRYAILMGGRGNGRSGTVSRYAISQLLSTEYTRGVIMRAVGEDIRASCWRDLVDRLTEQNVSASFNIADSTMVLKYGKNSLQALGFRASSGSLTARLKSIAGFNFVWIEEAEEIGEDEFRTLDDSLRTVLGRIRIILSLNTPPKNHWILRKWFETEPTDISRFYRPKLLSSAFSDVLYVPGTYRENEPNLDGHTMNRYKEYKKTKPDYYWQVIEGLSPEEVRGKIFNGWQQIDAVPRDARLVRFGEDFGWFPDPACVVAVYYWNGSYVIDEVAYGTELTNEYLAAQIKAIGYAVVIADSAEPKSIAEQNTCGITVRGAAKGADSVNYRIKLTTTKKIFVTRRSANVWKSYENYAWAENKDGIPKNEPAHMWSHCMDALMYPLADLHADSKPDEEQRSMFIENRSNQAKNSNK